MLLMRHRSKIAAGIHAGSPDYLLIIGEPGNKWAVYGGLTERNDFFNIYKSMGENAALKAGFRFGTYSETELTDNNESNPGDYSSEESNKYISFGFDTEYGFNKGDQEIAARFAFSFGPSSISYLVNQGYPGPFGTVESSITSAGATANEEGSASTSSFGLSASLRRPMNLLIFENLYCYVGLSRIGSASDFTDDQNTKIEDKINSSFSLSASTLVFNNTNLTDNTLLAYGVGFSLGLSNYSSEDKAVKETDTGSNFIIGGPRFRVGLETDFKYGKLRFGINRNINFFNRNKNVEETNSGTNVDEDEYVVSGIGSNGSYSFVSGLGFTYGNLNLDLILNNTFWCTGPQMIINTTYGTFCASADVSYYFNK
ncbi:MAG: hypothetical protein ABIA75_03250 [Candidatus Neomarinimicrobiota bacterium]